jgi:hypothetical protein
VAALRRIMREGNDAGSQHFPLPQEKGASEKGKTGKYP